MMMMMMMSDDNDDGSNDRAFEILESINTAIESAYEIGTGEIVGMQIFSPNVTRYNPSFSCFSISLCSNCF